MNDGEGTFPKPLHLPVPAVATSALKPLGNLSSYAISITSGVGFSIKNKNEFLDFDDRVFRKAFLTKLSL